MEKAAFTPSQLKTPRTKIPSPPLPSGTDQIIRPAQAAIMTGRSLASIWRDEHAGTFPKRRRIGKKSVGYLRSELEDWLRTRTPA